MKPDEFVTFIRDQVLALQLPKLANQSAEFAESSLDSSAQNVCFICLFGF